MGAGKSMNFEPAVLDKYATPRYYLSRGASGNVYGPIRWQGSQLAIKQVMFEDRKVTDGFIKDIEAKKVIWNSLEHKNLMRIHRVDLTRLPIVMYIVMDYAAGGSLHKTIKSIESENKLPIDIVTDWATQITEGMLYLHEKDIVHRDLKSSNILLMEPFHADNPHAILTLKIADFDEIKEHDHTFTMSTLVGTGAYMAPEVVKNQWFSKAGDVWSFGVVIWEMLTGDIPHKGLELEAILHKSINGTLDNLPLEPSFPENFKLLLNRCWESTHTKRIPFHEIFSILQHIVVDESELKRTLIPKAATDGKKAIFGLTILGDELFVLSHDWPKIEVFGDLQKLVSIREFQLTGHQLELPWDMQSSSMYNCLYIVDKKRNEEEKTEIFRINPHGVYQTKWKTECTAGRLSVTSESEVIVTSLKDRKIRHYTHDGELICIIDLLPTDIVSPWVTLKRGKDKYITSYGDLGDSRHGVCVIDKNACIKDRFGGEKGSSNDQMFVPVHMTAFSDGHLLVADEYNSRVVLLSPDVKFLGAIFTPPRERYPNRLCLDEINKQLFVSDFQWIGDMKPCNDGRVLVFDMTSVQTTFNIKACKK